MKSDLFLGGTPPSKTGASSRVYYGFVSFVEEEGALKVNEITFKEEFPMGGGHAPWRDSVEYMAQLAMDEGFSNQEMDTSNCSTRIIHDGRLAFVTCSDEDGSQIKTAKMVYPSSSAAGWICIQVLNDDLNSDKDDHRSNGIKLAKKKEFEKAILEYQKAIDSDDEDFKAYELMGYAFL
jgi:hypothetical protein